VSGNRAAHWAIPLTASLALHAAFLGLHSLNAPEPRSVAAQNSPGLTVALRRFIGGVGDGETSSAAPTARTDTETAAKTPKKSAPQTAAAKIKKDRAPAAVKKAEHSIPVPAERPAANAKEAESAEKAVSEGTASKEGLLSSNSPNSLKSQGGGRPAGAETGEGQGKIFELSDLKVSRRVKPDYPAIARKRKEEGTVTLLLTIEGASVSGVKVEQTSGFPMLDEAAIAAVRKWRFEPGAGTRFHKLQARVPVTFRLKS
jgi:protein TonB